MVVTEIEAIAEIADLLEVVVVDSVEVKAKAAPEAVAGNVVVLDVLPLIDQCRGVAVGQLPHPKDDEGLAQPLVRIKADAEVNLNTLVFFLLACQVHSLMFEL